MSDDAPKAAGGSWTVLTDSGILLELRKKVNAWTGGTMEQVALGGRGQRLCPWKPSG